MEEVKKETESTVTPEQQQQAQAKINELTARVVELEAEKKADALREAKASREAKSADPAPSAASQSMNRDRAVREVGGLAFWTSLSLPQRMKILLGCEWNPSQQDIELANSLFAPTSSGANAARIQKNNSALYSKMKCLYREL